MFMNRRGLLGAGTVCASVVLADQARAALDHQGAAVDGSLRTINITDAPWSADPSGHTDSAPAFQQAINSLTPRGGGIITIPPGNYTLGFPVTSPSGSITLWGCGKALSKFMVRHSGIAFTLTTNNPWDSIDVHHVGFSPVPEGGGLGGVALSLEYPGYITGWMHASVSDVDLCTASPGYSTFTAGIRLVNCMRGNFEGITTHAGVTARGTQMFELVGRNIDNHIVNCFGDGIDVAVNVKNYGEGLTLANCEFIANTGITTGNADYGNGNGINFLGLYISNGEFNCYQSAASLYQVNGGFLTTSHFGGKTAGVPAMVMTGCQSVLVNGNAFSGQFNQASPQQFTGLQINNSACCQADGNAFSNLLTGIVYGAGTTGCSSTATRMQAPGGSALVGEGYNLSGGGFISAFVDNSGNSSNFGEWISAAGRLPALRKRIPLRAQLSPPYGLAVGMP